MEVIKHCAEIFLKFVFSVRLQRLHNTLRDYDSSYKEKKVIGENWLMSQQKALFIL